MISKDDFGISMALPIVVTIMDSVEKGDTGVITLKRGLLTAMKERFGSMEEEPFFAVSTFLDARFKENFFLQHSHR